MDTAANRLLIFLTDAQCVTVHLKILEDDIKGPDEEIYRIVVP